MTVPEKGQRAISDVRAVLEEMGEDAIPQDTVWRIEAWRDSDGELRLRVFTRTFEWVEASA